MISRAAYIVQLLSFVLAIPFAGAEQWFVIVDGVSTGSYLAPAIRSKAQKLGLDVKIAHVQSAPEYSKFFSSSFHPEDYDRLFVLNQNQSNQVEVLQSLAALHPTFTIAGTETGVVLADQFNAQLQVAGNPTAYSILKRDKERLYRFLFDHGLSSAPSAGASSVQDALDWLDKTKVKFPIIAKPLDDAGGHGFRTIKNKRQLAVVLNELFSGHTMFGEKINRVILQPKLSGAQYAINGSIHAGKVVFTDVLQYEKDEAVYLRDKLLDPRSAVAVRQMDYTERLLLELRLNFGNFHVEIIDSPEYGLVPIDIAGRAMGGKDHKMVLECTGYTQVMAIAEALLDPDSFNKRSQRREHGLPAYDFEKGGYLVDLTHWHEGTISDLSGLSFLSSLQTYAGSWIDAKLGERVSRTGNLLDSPGAVMLVGEPQQLEEDYLTLRQRERRNQLIAVEPLSFCERALSEIKRLIGGH